MVSPDIACLENSGFPRFPEFPNKITANPAFFKRFIASSAFFADFFRFALRKQHTQASNY
jgi:hypothetical protein